MKSKVRFKQKLVLLSAVLLFTILTFPSNATAGEVVNGSGGEYYLSAPQTSSPAPVLVFLHGMGNDQDQGRRIFDNYTLQANMFLVSPTGGSQNQSWMRGSGPSVKQRVQEVLSKYDNADENNVYLVGYSAGGGVAYDFGPADSSFYKGMCIINAPFYPGSIPLSGQLPVYLIECEGDPNKPGAEMAKKEMESAGYDVKYDIIPGSQGGSSHSYPTSAASPMVISWIQASAKTGTDSSSDNNDDDSSDDNSSTDNTSTSDDNDSNSSSINSDDIENSGDSNSDSPNGDEKNDNNTSDDIDDKTDNGSADNNNDEGNKNDGQNSNDKADSNKTEEVVEEPVVNSFGIPVGGLTDSEIDNLVKEWLANVFKPSQSPPDDKGGWSLNDWGIWTNGNITHSGKIDGFGSVVDFWLKTNPDCFAFAESRGSEMHIPATIEVDVNDSDDNSKEDDEAVANTEEKSDDKDVNDSSSDNDKNAPGSDANSNNTDSNNTDSNNDNDTSTTDPAVTVADPDNGSSSENVPDLAAAESSGDNTPENVNGRQVNIYTPAGLESDENSEYGLVVALSGIAGNSDYLKMKLSAGCDSNKCVFAGLKAKNATGDPYGFRWENDVAENIEFIKEVVKTFETKYGLSPSRTFIVGFSGGAHFVGSQASTIDNDFEGFIMCEGGDVLSTSDKWILISGGGVTGMDSDNSGRKWLALCENMGHFFPGQPMAQDPGVSVDSAGHTINGETMIKWLEE